MCSRSNLCAVLTGELMCVFSWSCLCLFRLVSSVSLLVSVCYIDLQTVLVFLTFILFVFREQKMVQRIIEIMANYENRLREMQSVPRLSYGCGLVCTDG